MPTPAQYAANRLNAVKSTGPASPKGKVRSSLNALRHGLTARVVVLPSEDLNAYQAFSREIVDSLDAQTPVERQFAQTVADNQWRINRIRSIEDGMLAEAHFERAGDFDAEHPDIHSTFTASRAFQAHSKEFVNLSLYEQRLHRSMREALHELKELQSERRERHRAHKDDAVRLHKPAKMKGLPDDAAQIGFVYATAETGLEQHRLHLSKASGRTHEIRSTPPMDQAKTS
jgi:hypothetical protein